LKVTLASSAEISRRLVSDAVVSKCAFADRTNIAFEIADYGMLAPRASMLLEGQCDPVVGVEPQSRRCPWIGIRVGELRYSLT